MIDIFPSVSSAPANRRFDAPPCEVLADNAIPHANDAYVENPLHHLSPAMK